MMITFFKKLFNKKETVTPSASVKAAQLMDEIIISIQPPRELAKVVPLVDVNAEYTALEEKYAEFFSTGKPQKESSANIADVTPSKSDLFFKQAPAISMTMGDEELGEDFLKQTEDIEALEKYNGIPVYNREQTATELEIQLELEELELHGYAERHHIHR